MKQIMSCIVVSVLLAHGGDVLAQCCTCDGDLDGSGFAGDDGDIPLLTDCINNVPGACDACVVPGCDVNCDGVVNINDELAIICMFEAGGLSPNLSCCGGGRGGLPLCECNFDSECTGGQVCIDNACTDAIPTVSEWGMALLVLLVLTVGSVVFRWRSPARGS